MASSLHPQDMKPRVKQQLKRVESNLSRISGLSSLAGSVRSITSSSSRGDSVRSKTSWASQSSRQGKPVIEPDQDILRTLRSWNENSNPRKIRPKIIPKEPDVVDEDDYEHHNATRDGGVVVMGIISSSKEDPTDHGCPLDHLEIDGIPTTYSEDKGSAFTEDYVMQVEQELKEAKENVHKAKKELKHYSALHDQALQSKDFDKPPSRCPDPSPFMGYYYDRAVMNTATSQDAQEFSPPLVRATRKQWGVMANGEAKVEKWKRAVDEWEEVVVQLQAEILSFQIDLDVVSEEEEGEEEDCECGCQGERASKKIGDRRSSDGSETTWSYGEEDGSGSGFSSSRSNRSNRSNSSSSSKYSRRYVW